MRWIGILRGWMTLARDMASSPAGLRIFRPFRRSADLPEK